jgi:transglutaminase-like putative cysteine protease
MEEPARSWRTPQELIILALLIAASAPLFRLFQPGGLGSVVFLTIGLSLGTSYLTRRYRLPALLAWLASVAAMVWFLSVRFLPDTLWGIFPSGETFSSFGPLISEGIRRSVEEVAPVTPSAPLLFLVAAGVWVTTWLAEAASMWIGSPLLAVGSTIPLLIVPGAVIKSRHLWFDIAVWLGAAAWVVFDDEKRRASAAANTSRSAGWRGGPAARIAALAAITAVALMPLTPGYGGAPGFGTGSGGNRVLFNPLVAIQPTLNRSPERPLFQVETNKPSYMRLTSLDVFDGKTWRPGPDRTTSAIENIRRDPDAPFGTSSGTRQTVHIQALAGPWLPAAYDPVALTSRTSEPTGAMLEDVSRALILQDGSVRSGMIYDVISAIPDVRADLLEKAQPLDPQLLARYLQLPAIPAQVREIAQRIAGSEPTQYRKALALQQFLRGFTYDIDVAAGHSYNDLVGFLTRSKRGYCEQFSAAMAVMARTLGIPARVAIGFGFGHRVNSNIYQVTTNEAHAWTEIYFAGYGWLTFEPTPRNGVARVPRYATEETPAAPSASPTASATASPSSTSSANPRDPADKSKDPSNVDTTDDAGTTWIRRAIKLGVVVTVALIIIVIVRWRRRSTWIDHPPHEAVAARYVDFLRWCASAGLARAPGETPTEHATRLSQRAPAAADDLAVVSELADEALWAPPNGLVEDDFARAAAAARTGIEAELRRPERVKALVGWGRWRSTE